MGDALRVGGRTIKTSETYSGREVMTLLTISYRNGYEAGMLRKSDQKASSKERDYMRGYQDGKEEAEQHYAEIRAALQVLRRYLNEEGGTL